jgi:hypothetical protein
MGTRDSFPGGRGVKRRGVKLTTHLHLVQRSKNAWSYTSTPNTPSWRDAQVKHRDNFTFSFNPPPQPFFREMSKIWTKCVSTTLRNNTVNHYGRVCTADGHSLEDQGSIPSKDVSLRHTSSTSPVLSQLPNQTVPGSPSTGVKRSHSEADHSSATYVEVNAWRFTLTALNVFKLCWFEAGTSSWSFT